MRVECLVGTSLREEDPREGLSVSRGLFSSLLSTGGGERMGVEAAGAVGGYRNHCDGPSAL